MGTCRYCGLSTGLFSHSHKECENKHVNAVSEFEKVCTAFLTGIRLSQISLMNGTGSNLLRSYLMRI